MKVGDLVTLSAYGKKRDWNWTLIRNDSIPIGVIYKVGKNGLYPYRVHWRRYGKFRPYHCPDHSRKELKYASR